MKTEHILIIRFSAMGDVAMTVPIVSSLAQQYPSVRFTVLSKPFARAFFENLAPNVGFMGADIKGEYRGMKGLNALYRRLSAKQFTAIADTLRSKYLRMRFNLSRNRVEHINKHKCGRRKLISQHNKQFLQQPTSFENYAEVFRKLGYPIEVRFTSIFDENSEPLLTKNTGEKWIGIAPFAAHLGKIYPLEKMERVIGILCEKNPSYRLFLFGGGKNENEKLGEWAAKFPQCTLVSSLVSGLREELRVMQQLDVMLSMDSANMHMASLTNTPVVSIWGATHPYAGFMGWNQSESNAVQVDMPCRPCSVYGKKACHRGDYACLNDIQPEAVVEKLLSLLS